MKKSISILLIVSFVCTFLASCKLKQGYGDYPFVNVEWTRSTKSDTEFINFYDDGNFSYYCGCGNPVNDSDLCEGYTYDDGTKTITLKYSEKTEEAITSIIVKKCTDNELILDFNGDIRTFENAKQNKKSDSITYEGNTYLLIEYPADIFNYNLSENVNYEEDEIYKVEHDNWDIIYRDGDLFALESDMDAVNKYYGDNKNYNWWVKIEDVNSDYEKTLQLSLSEDELDFLNNIEDSTRDETIFFEEIEVFATLAKTSKDGFITATTELNLRNDAWYWRSGIIDEKTAGWPEFIFKLPQSLNDKISKP